MKFTLRLALTTRHSFLLLLVLTTFAISCTRQEVIETTGPIRLTPDVRIYSYFGQDGKIVYYWHTFLYQSRTSPAKATVMLQWDTVDEAGQFIKNETYRATIKVGQPNPAVENTFIKSLPSQKPENIRITAVQCDDPSKVFTY
jgi:hypothetical protein